VLRRRPVSIPRSPRLYGFGEHRCATVRATITGPSAIFTGVGMKTSYAAILVLALPACRPGACRQPCWQPAGNPITTAFRTRTLGLQQPCPGIRLHPRGQDFVQADACATHIGYIAQHLASDNYFFCNNFGAMKARSWRRTLPPQTRSRRSGRDTLVSKLKASLKFCERLRPDDDARCRPDHIAGAQRPDETPRAPGARPRTRRITTVSWRTTCA
jgi:hypothetical protein